MRFTWLKNYLPRSLYWRAALIIMLPFLVLQVVVSVVFIQRHFEDVTQQMIDNLERDLSFVLEAVRNEGPEVSSGRLAEFDFTVTAADAAPAAVPGAVWYDLSAGFVETELRSRYDISSVDLSDRSRVVLWLEEGGQNWQVSFDRSRASARNPHQLLVLMVFTGLVMILISWQFLRNQLRPIKRLARAAEAFGRGRNVAYHPSGAIEVRSAGNAFLDMRQRIERHIEQRTLLLSGVSHDLRTPLTRMHLGLSMMDGQPEAEDMRRDVEEMRRMLDTFLEYSRDDAGEEPEENDLCALVGQAVDDARRAGATILFDSPASAEVIRLRHGGVRRAIDNLLSNAARYGTQIRVSIIGMERSVRVSVEDDGQGIPEDQREEALKPFSRLDTSRNQNRGGGVGLGLAIAADIARVHGGALRLGASEDLGGLQADLILAR